MKKMVLFLFSILLLFQAIDVATTYIGLYEENGYEESNPIVKWIIENLGIIPLIFLKLLTSISILILTEEEAKYVLGLCNFFYFLIILNNILILVK